MEDYKSVQQILERKLEAQDEALIHDKEQMSEKLRQIERKFKTDKEKYNGHILFVSVKPKVSARPKSLAKLVLH